jgi:hypothetical protein
MDTKFLRLMFMLFPCWAVGLAAAAQDGRPTLHPAGAGTVRALVIGIDRYPNLAPQAQLRGAVADAKDIAAALRQRGVGELRVLLDAEVTRNAVTAAFEALVTQSAAGDLVIVTFAGHGSQDKGHAKEEPDGKDETFLLSLIAEKGENASERIIDGEIFAWLRRLGDKGAEVIFLADSCHGGGMTKAPTRSSGPSGVRGIPRVFDRNEAGPGSLYIAPEDDRLSLPGAIPVADNATLRMPSLTFLSGVDAQSNVVEIPIAGQATRRGALSYAFARFIESGSPEGGVTRGSLFKSLRQSVLALTQHQQYPVFEPWIGKEAAERVLFRGPERMSTGLRSSQPPSAAEARVIRSDSTQTIGPPDGPVAFWDKTTGNVALEAGPMLAYAVPESMLATVAKRIRVSTSLASIAAGAPLQAELSPDRTTFVSNQSFKLVIDGVRGRYLTITNLSGSGEIQHLFPKGNADALMTDDRLTIPMRAGAPFGADTLIIVASQERQKSLELDLQLLDGESKPDELLNALRSRWQAGDLMGVITYQTRP